MALVMRSKISVIVILMLLCVETFCIIEGECPRLCKCHTNEIYCVGDGASSIPDVPWTMRTLYFRNYSIHHKVLWAELINGTSITEMLTMENVRIDSIADGAFASLPNLRMLDLEGNNLRFLNMEAFRGLRQLRELYLCRNKLTQLNSSFALLEKLNLLDLSGNLIARLTDSMFIGINRYLQLILSSNNISDLGEGGFVINTYISKIDLSNNPLNGNRIAIGANNAFYLDLSRIFGLRTIPFISASLTGLSLANNVIETINNSDIMKLSGDYLRFRALNLDNNRIYFIEDDSLLQLESLSVLRLTNNRLFDIPFQLPPSLRELHLGGNLIKEVPAFSFPNNTNLHFLILNDNQIDILHPCSFCGLNELTMLDLKNNLIKHLPEGVFMDLDSLYSLNLQSNPIMKLESGCFLGVRRLTEVNLSFLSHNITFQESVFDDLESLSVLKMQNSTYLAHKFLESPRIFKRLSEITFLDISYNNLSTLDSSISTTFRRLRSLDLSVNNWSCDHNLLWLSNWMKSKPHIFLYLDDLNCTSPREIMLTPIISFSDVEPQSTTEPSTSSTTRKTASYNTTIITTSKEPELLTFQSFTETLYWYSFTGEAQNLPFNEGRGMVNREEKITFVHSSPSIGTIFGYSVLGVTVFVLVIIASLLVLNFYRRKRQLFSTLTKFPGFLFKGNGKGISVGYENVITGDQDLLNFDN